MQSIFGDVYDKKRLAPGQVTEARPDVVLHDCSTLGGNSGSVVLDLATGEAVGLHFAGRFLEANYAVPAAVVAARLEQVLRPKPPGRPPARPHRRSAPAQPVVTPTTRRWHGHAAGSRSSKACRRTTSGAPATTRRFVGVDVPLPVVRNTSDVLTFPWNGRQESELKYQHFSVVMSRSRRLCIFSAGQHRRQHARAGSSVRRGGWIRAFRRVSRSARSATGTNRCSRAAT